MAMDVTPPTTGDSNAMQTGSGLVAAVTWSPPPFRPHRLLRNGHLQTLAGAWWRANRVPICGTTQHEIPLPDGDRLILHDDRPAEWDTGGRAALLVHGLAGCHGSSYMVRIARKLVARSVRAFRLDLRGCGAGRNQARQPYHAGRWLDIEAAANRIHELCPQSPLGVVGFSLSGNLVLRWLGESPATAGALVERALAVNPPVDLALSTDRIARTARGMYDRHFARLLYRQIRDTSQWNAESPLARAMRRPQRIIDFDELFTAPLSGYDSADHYYRSASAAPVVPRIETPTLILSAADDPLIPVEMLTALELPPQVRLHIEPHGGHLGFIAERGGDPDRHWMDWRVVEWIAGRVAE